MNTTEPILQLWNYLSPIDKAIIGVIIAPLFGFVWKLYSEIHAMATNCVPHLVVGQEKTNDLLAELLGYMRGFAEGRHEKEDSNG